MQTTTASHIQTHSSAIPSPRNVMKHHCYGYEVSTRLAPRCRNSPCQVPQKPLEGCDASRRLLLSPPMQTATRRWPQGVEQKVNQLHGTSRLCRMYAMRLPARQLTVRACSKGRSKRTSVVRAIVEELIPCSAPYITPVRRFHQMYSWPPTLSPAKSSHEHLSFVHPFGIENLSDRM